MKNLGYWIPTVLAAITLLMGGFGQLSHNPEMVTSMAHLGYPAYFMTLIGLWKVLAALAILAPGLPRLKEWAYAGIFFVLTGASVSHFASGDPFGKAIVPLVIVAIAFASWALRPEGRKLRA